MFTLERLIVSDEVPRFLVEARFWTPLFFTTLAVSVGGGGGAGGGAGLGMSGILGLLDEHIFLYWLVITDSFCITC